MDRSQVDLANAALAYLVRDSIRDLDGSGPSAVHTKQHMTAAIEEVIEEWDWPQTRVVIAAQPVLGVNLRGWGGAYSLPDDCVKIWRVSTDFQGLTLATHEQGMSDVPGNDRTYLFSQAGGVYIRYGSRKTSLGRFSPQTFDLIALVLAAKCCMLLTKDAKLLAYLQQQYLTKSNKLKVSMANAEPEFFDTDFTPDVIRVRSE